MTERIRHTEPTFTHRLPRDYKSRKELNKTREFLGESNKSIEEIKRKNIDKINDIIRQKAQ